MQSQEAPLSSYQELSPQLPISVGVEKPRYSISPIPHANGVHQIDIDPGWRPLLEEIVTLKDGLDHALRWHDEGEPDDWLVKALQPYGLVPGDFGPALPLRGPSFPDLFVQMLLGKCFRRTSQESASTVMAIPPWAVLGWVRKSAYRSSPTASQAELLARVDAILDWRRPGAHPEEAPYTEYWDTFPLFLAGEGKNRAQLHRLAGVDRIAPVTCMPFPNVQGFVARPMFGLPWAVVVESDAFPAQVLPFRRISEPLVKKLGLRWDPSSTWKDLNALVRSVRANRNGGHFGWVDVAHWWAHPKALKIALIAGAHAGRLAVARSG